MQRFLKKIYKPIARRLRVHIPYCPPQCHQGF